MIPHYLTCYPLHLDPLDAAVNSLLDLYHATLPDLSQITVLFANSLAIKPFRKKLSAAVKTRGHAAILGPELITLDQWLENFPPPPDRQLIPAEHRLLLLAGVLQKYPALYGESNAWHLAEDLLAFFDQLTEQMIQLPESESAFISWLSSLYGSSPSHHNGLLKEAHLIRTLWHAWHAQLDASGFCDRESLKAFRLSHSLHILLAEKRIIYMLGFDRLSPALSAWANKLADSRQLHWLYSGSPIKADTSGLLCAADLEIPAQSIFYNACYDHQTLSLQARAQTLRNQMPESPVKDRVWTVPAISSEQQAEVVVLLVRQALQRNEKSVAIITEDRRLGRRIRALLERYQIVLQDHSGWALSTTSASTVIENWLRCLEEDFPYLAFLDLLKSPFFSVMPSAEEQLELVYRLEQDIILHENIAEGLDRYQHALKRRMARLTDWSGGKAAQLEQLLAAAGEAAAHITGFVHPIRKFPAQELLAGFANSLRRLSILENLANDAAGQLIVSILQKLQQAATADPSLYLSWLDFRTCLGRLLESNYFIPATDAQDVYLLNLEQSHFLSFDSVILAAANERHLPGEMQGQPFFSNAVRKNLGLRDWQYRYAEQACRFRAILERSQKLTIIWQSEENGEPLSPSPWIRAIEYFHTAAYGISIRNSNLLEQVRAAEAERYREAAIDSNPVVQPRPACNTALLPDRLSVSAYQRLMNCPYQFYVSDLLKLKPGDEIREVMQKADYGSRIHACLEAFHTDITGLPGPFRMPLIEAQHAAACELMLAITKKIFSQDMEDNFQHRGWYKRWIKCIPAYIDWEIQRHAHWNFESAEQTAEVSFAAIRLYGRIDRIDQQQNNRALIDYKTGSISSRDKVLQGEDIQLSSYALMLPDVTQIEYLSIGHDATVSSKTIISTDSLHDLCAALEQRTKIVIQMLTEAATLPAWADPESCRHCNYAGICRRHTWQDKQHEQQTPQADNL